MRHWARHHLRTWSNSLLLPVPFPPSHALPNSSASLLRGGTMVSWTAEQVNTPFIFKALSLNIHQVIHTAPRRAIIASFYGSMHKEWAPEPSSKQTGPQRASHVVHPTHKSENGFSSRFPHLLLTYQHFPAGSPRMALSFLPLSQQQ